MIRNEAVAGQFYEADKESLTLQIEDCFLGSKGVGHLPKENTQKEEANKEKTNNKKQTHKESIIGAISPHAGYYFSGQAASFVYEKISKCDIDTIIILGPNHYGTGSNITTTLNQSWNTPLGIVQIDRNFISKLIELNKDVKDNPNAHTHEHSIEVQLPFLEFIKNNSLFVPLMIKDLSEENCKQLAEDINTTAKKLNKKILVIASSDFTHYGSNFNYEIFNNTNNVKENIKSLDMSFVELIKKLDAKEFYKKSKDSTICGRLPITILLFYLKQQKITQTKLEAYYTSDDIMPSHNKSSINSVSYVSMIFE
jgi:hypothetical protein